MTDYNRLLRGEPLFWSRLGFCYDPPIRDAAGRPLIMYADQSRFVRYHRQFADAGVRIHTSILHAGWMGEDEYDYSLTDRILDEFFAANPDCLYMPRVKLNVPPLWCRAHPEDTFVYWEGAPHRTAAEIADLAGGPRQDWLGYEAEHGYQIADADFVDPRPNVRSLIALQSVSSEQWKRDAGEALARLIDHIESGPYAERIVGYHVGFGPCAEVMQWGRACGHYGDYGIAQLRNFYRWAEEKYGSREGVRAAWELPEIDENACFLPSPEVRYARNDTLDGLMRVGKMLCIDYDRFVSDAVVDAVTHFGRIVKEKTGKAYGSFYGYMNFCENAQYAGHLAIDRLLDSPYIDFLAAPKSYYRANENNPGGEMIPAQSVNLKKLWLDELDNRTFLAGDGNGRVDNVEDTCGVFWREFAKNLSHNSGFWWMDLGGGWFDHPALMAQVERMARAKRLIEQQPYESAADVLVLMGEEGMLRAGVSTSLTNSCSRDFLAELAMSGVLFDTYRLSDIHAIDMSRYRLVIFAHTLAIGGDVPGWARSLEARGATLMFNYAAGYYTGDRAGLDSVRAFTGFDCAQDGLSEDGDCPTLCITDADVEILAAENDRAKLVRRGRRVMNCLSRITRCQLREIAERAQCRLIGEAGAVYYGDARFTGVFFSGKNAIHLPEKADWRDLASGALHADTDCVRTDGAKAMLLLREQKD